MRSFFHTVSVEDVLRDLGTRRDGLASAEAEERLRRVGPNELQRVKLVAAWRILARQLGSVVALLLSVACLAAFFIGEPLQSLAIAAVLVINTLLGFSTELRAHRAMEALVRLDVPRALVLRDGFPTEIDARHVVPGDVLLLEEGRQIAADARVIYEHELRTTESALTGESLPVEKGVDPVAADAPLPEWTSLVFKGTSVAAGSGHAVVVGTGMDTEVGQIGGMLDRIRGVPTPLERRLDSLGRRLAALAITLGAVVAGIGFLNGLPAASVIQTGIALAIAAVPEGLPAVATIALAIGVHRMARRSAIVRRPPSVESLGSVTVICTDKTGTLTAGEMAVTVLAFADREIQLTGSGYEAQGAFRAENREIDRGEEPRVADALRVAALANRAGISRRNQHWEVRGDPTEAALLIAAAKADILRGDLVREFPEVGEIPFSSERMFMATFHEMRDGGRQAFVKGAPSRVLDRCGRVLRRDGSRQLTGQDREILMRKNQELASRGLRVLAVARGQATGQSEEDICDLEFIAFAGLIDPPAPGVAETIQQFRDAGIRTVMLTGDQRLTAIAVARDLGILEEGGDVIDGRELRTMGAAELEHRIRSVAAFSRVSPGDKLTIVESLQRGGDIVAMLGDGINDAAALRKADVGVSMGTRGTDVAKEAASIVLRDDRFQTIGAAIEEGRIVFDNIRKFVFYLFSCNLAEILVLLIAGVAGWPMPLLPLQILWVNLVTDTFPALALAVEPGEPDVLHRPPMDPKKAILSGRFIGSLSFYAALITAATLAAFLIGLRGGGAAERAVTMSFMTIGLAQAFHLANARGHSAMLTAGRALSNPYALMALVLVVGLQCSAVLFAPLAGILGTVPLASGEWGIAVALALVPAVIGQALKLTPWRTRFSPLV